LKSRKYILKKQLKHIECYKIDNHKNNTKKQKRLQKSTKKNWKSYYRRNHN